MDEKFQIRALGRMAPGMPMHPGRPATRTHDYVRHGTSTLFAALQIATGHVTAVCKPRHRHQEFVAFLKQVVRAYREGQLHLVMDYYAMHKAPEVKAWLAEDPRYQVHFTPTSTSSLNLVELWFGTIERQALHRVDVASVAALNARIPAFVTGWNDRCHPFVRTKTSADIRERANRPTTSKTAH